MTRTTRWLVSSIAVLTLSSPAVQAQEWKSGLYLEAGGGLSLLSDTDYSQGGVPFSTQAKEGFILSGALGRQFQNVHMELEALYFENEFDQINLPGFGSGTLSGDVTVIGGMFNVYYDFDFGANWRPYLGGGAGLVQVSLNDVSINGIPFTDEDDRSLAFQLKAGISYSLNNHMDFVVNYRYFNTRDANFTDTTNTSFSTDHFESHGIEARIRIRY